MEKGGTTLNNKDCGDKKSNNCSDKAELDCEYSSSGLCDDCSLPENDICPFEDEFK